MSRVLGGRADLFDRLEDRARKHPARLGTYNLVLAVVRLFRRVVDVRITGLAAEMTYYALISLVPLVTAVGAALGFLERVLGEERVLSIEQGLVRALAAVFDEELTDDVLAPLVTSLLREERAGIAVGGVLLAMWLSGRMFRAAIRALDDAYGVPERRGLVAQFALGLALSLGAVLTLVTLLGMVVVGPLLGRGSRVADAVGLAEEAGVVWTLLRWPAVAATCIGFLVVLYRHGPNVRNTWRECLPGALVGMAGLVAVSLGFQVYLDVAGPGGPDLETGGAAVAVAAQTLGAVLAGVVWLWLSSIVILTGGVLNAELQRQREELLAEPTEA